MDKICPRVRAALLTVSRNDFIAGKDLSLTTTGHSIPSRKTVAHILSIIPEVTFADIVMHIGGGSGYLAAVLSQLARDVIYVEKNTYVAQAAQERFTQLGLQNIKVLAQAAENPLKINQSYDLVLCTTLLDDIFVLQGYVREGGTWCA